MSTSLNKIAILGAGWLGWPLAKKLVEADFIVNASTTSSNKLDALAVDGINPFLINLLSTGPEGKNLETFLKADLIIINIPPGRRDPAVESNFPKKIKSLIPLALKAGVTRCIFVSSTSVYGDAQGRVNEKTPPLPTTNSGKALLSVEEYLQSLPQLNTTILRPGGLVGGDRLAGRFLAGKKEIPNGNAPVNMIHRRDLMNIILEIINQNALGKTFNCVTNQSPTRRDFYTYQAKKYGFEVPEFLKDGGTGSFKLISNGYVKKILGYQFVYGDPMMF
jgi:Nucleoside-diphosphate-sugar epimerases